jgi:hypothetical protein
MMRWLVILLFACVSWELQAQTEQQADTATIVKAIEERMRLIDRAPVGAVYLTIAGQNEPMLLAPDSAVKGNVVERNEIYLDPFGTPCGVGTFYRSPAPGIVESSMHYFDANGATIAASWQLRWDKSQCTDSVAVETRFLYFYPATKVIFQYATMTDGVGRKLDPTTCRYPNIERHFDSFYHRDMLLLSKGIKLP